jgi:hypothetical protein
MPSRFEDQPWCPEWHGGGSQAEQSLPKDDYEKLKLALWLGRDTFYWNF